jgi:hypothetical protein
MDRWYSIIIIHRSIYSSSIIIIIMITYHVLSDHPNLLEVSIHLIVQLGEPVSHPELEQAA